MTLSPVAIQGMNTSLNIIGQLFVVFVIAVAVGYLWLYFHKAEPTKNASEGL